MPTARLLMLTLALATATATRIAAQRAPEFIDEAVRIGSHVRVTTTNGKTYMGTVTRFTTDTIALNVQGADGKLPTAAVQRLQLRVAKRSGYTIGAVIGGVLGAAALLAAEQNWENKCDCTRKAPPRAGAIIGGSAVGIAVGAIIGGAVHRDRWRDVVLARQ